MAAVAMANEVPSPLQEISQECIRLRKVVVQPLNDKYKGPLDKTTVHNTALPFVLLLGNHSSGKSSFVNHILKREVQVSGVAPTDDGFTIIGSGLEDVDRAGPALLGDPDLGFGGLKHFGPMLSHRTQLKLRKDVAIKDLMLVDTPGMIDSPGGTGGGGMDRGYDFEGVCRWYAERADVILLFFDPDKPGTTGETLQVLTNSLVGLDHKLHIILNKADQFRKIHDFARAYGSLCWNLSKVIPRKDLPQIHTMCLPVKGSSSSLTPTPGGGRPTFLGINLVRLAATPAAGNDKSTPHASASVSALAPSSSSSTLGLLGSGESEGEGQFLVQGLLDLEAARAGVEKEVFNAPKRRVDNEISRLTDSVHAVLMHAKVADDVVERYHAALLRYRLTLLGCSVAWGGLAALVGGLLLPSTPSNASLTTTSSVPSSSSSSVTTSSSSAPVAAGLSPSAKASALTLGLGGLSSTLLFFYQSAACARLRSSLCSSAGLTEAFQRLFARQIVEKDAFSASLWESVQARMLLSVTPDALQTLPRVRPADTAALERLLEVDVAQLRRKAFVSTLSAAGSAPGEVQGKKTLVREPLTWHGGLLDVFVGAGNTLEAANGGKAVADDIEAVTEGSQGQGQVVEEQAAPSSPPRRTGPRAAPLLLTPVSQLRGARALVELDEAVVETSSARSSTPVPVDATPSQETA